MKVLRGTCFDATSLRNDSDMSFVFRPIIDSLQSVASIGRNQHTSGNERHIPFRLLPIPSTRPYTGFIIIYSYFPQNNIATQSLILRYDKMILTIITYRSTSRRKLG